MNLGCRVWTEKGVVRVNGRVDWQQLGMVVFHVNNILYWPVLVGYHLDDNRSSSHGIGDRFFPI